MSSQTYFKIVLTFEIFFIYWKGNSLLLGFPYASFQSTFFCYPTVISVKSMQKLDDFYRQPFEKSALHSFLTSGHKINESHFFYSMRMCERHCFSFVQMISEARPWLVVVEYKSESSEFDG